LVFVAVLLAFSLLVRGGLAFVFVAVAKGSSLLVRRGRKRARMVKSCRVLSSAACCSLLRAAPPRKLVPCSTQLSASRSWL